MDQHQKPVAGNFAFIDNQNLNLGIQKLGWKMNWRKFREFLGSEHNVSKAYMFIGYMPNFEDLYTQMHDLGYLVVLKPTLEMYNAEVEGAPVKPQLTAAELEKKPPVKGNVDAELVLYAVKEMPNYDKAIVVSGDGDFYSLVEYLTEQGKLASLMAPNRQYSSLLKPFESSIIRLDQYKRQLSYHDKRGPKGQGR